MLMLDAGDADCAVCTGGAPTGILLYTEGNVNAGCDALLSVATSFVGLRYLTVVLLDDAQIKAPGRQ